MRQWRTARAPRHWKRVRPSPTPPDAMSVVEDRLVSIESLVEPPDAVPAPDSTQDGPREVRAGDVGVGEVCAGQIGAREIDLAQVRGPEVGARHVGAHNPHRL